MPLAERFLSKVRLTSQCWWWTGTLTKGGYGQFRAKGRVVGAHRFMYEWWHGPIPDGLQLDHLCRNRACVRPSHLDPVTGVVNQNRGLINQNAPKSACPKCGGSYDYEYTGTNGKQWRRCTKCFNAYRRQRRATA